MTVLIMRGIPGSGKSHYAMQALKEHNKGTLHGLRGIIVSADHYFEDVLGAYNFVPADIGKAHQACFVNFMTALNNHVGEEADSLIIVDNTNIHAVEIAPYVLAGQAYSHEVKIVQVSRLLEDCIKSNIHGVPEATIRRMHKEMEPLLPYWPKEETFLVGGDVVHRAAITSRLLHAWRKVPAENLSALLIHATKGRDIYAMTDLELVDAVESYVDSPNEEETRE